MRQDPFGTKNPQLQHRVDEKVERVGSEEDKGMISQKVVMGAGAGVIGVYLLMWMFYWIFKGGLWSWSLDWSEGWSQIGGYWTVHFWIFSKPLYVWWLVIVGALLLLAPSKESAIRSLLVFFLSTWTNAHFRIWSGASRPVWNDLDIVIRETCDCSFGMPSWQTHMGTLVWCLLVYDLVYKTKHFTKMAKITWIAVASFLILNLIFAEIFYGQNSVPQVFIGAFHGLAWFAGILILDPWVLKITRGVAEGNRIHQAILAGIGFLMMLLNFIIWYSAYDSSIADMDIPHKRCVNCFKTQNYGVRNQMARDLAFTNMFFGIALGLLVANPNYDGPNDFMVENHLSVKGGMRIGLMAALHLPLIFILFWSFRPNNTFWFNTLFWVVVGFLITFVDILLNSILGWNFKGDLYPKGRNLSSGAEGQSLLDSKMHYNDPKQHFNPYSSIQNARNRPGENPSMNNSWMSSGSASKRKPAPEIYL